MSILTLKFHVSNPFFIFVFLNLADFCTINLKRDEENTNGRLKVAI